MKKPNTTRQDAIDQLWRQGSLWWKLDASQKDLYNTFHNSEAKTIVWNCSRRFGKGHTLLIIGMETCLRNPYVIVKYVAPQKRMVRTIIAPLIRKIIADAPSDCRPVYRTQEQSWLFPNGSEIQMAGSDNGNMENLRGGEANLCIVDEAGFCEQLDYTVKSILLPTMTTTNGKIILASTSPLSQDHDFCDFVKTAKLTGSLVVKTIDDIDENRVSKEQKEAYIEELGGKESVTVKREYYCIQISDVDRMVVPEFTEELALEIVKEWKRPPFYDPYTSMDIGHKDLTFVLFGYYDFKHDKLIIEDEYVINGPAMTTDILAENIKKKENILWKDPILKEPIKPYLRVADRNLILINDLQRLHKLTFIPTNNQEVMTIHNDLRMRMAAKKIIINPRCVTLISHLKGGTWDKQRKKYERNVDDLGREHHYDGISSLVYMNRNILWSKNPYPIGFDLPKGEHVFLNKTKLENLNPFERTIKKMFTPTSTIRRR